MQVYSHSFVCCLIRPKANANKQTYFFSEDNYVQKQFMFPKKIQFLSVYELGLPEYKRKSNSGIFAKTEDVQKLTLDIKTIKLC